ncbi:hypothetical protein [Paramagnetospirillum magneticum]|uniref:Uncharacterized protein n=1 Tax=Paramagnetospirillum magneticum (strain ATCC 700264 / AMB-1) TaxID=342108 RepID=Q2W4K8_PARM1|nr:hypothetical protein [Paramagnetospirillum magneticum]BAE51217.1 hypothetical protein amb2413 [Paramagnetospirillum magneticum AMB-1]
MPEIIASMAQLIAPGALPAGAILYAWWKLDKRITVLEAQWEILWEHHKSKED